MLASRRCPGLFRLAILLAGLPALLAAEPIHVSGQIRIPAETVQGLAGARVELLPQTGEAPLATARTDAAGFFELTAPESGCFRVRMRAAGYLDMEAPFVPVAEEMDLTPAPALASSDEKQIAPGSPAGGGWIFGAAAGPSPATPRLVQGKVIGPKGAPVAGALVWSDGAPATPCVKSGADGAFQIRVPASGEVRLRAVAAGYFVTEPQAPSPPGSKGAPFALRLAAAGSITGRVVDEAGRPVPRARVQTLPGSPTGEGAVWSRADGRFRLSALSPGRRYQMAVNQDGFAPASVAADALPAGRPPVPVRIVLARGATMLGKLQDPEGKPVPGAELTLAFYQEAMISPGLSWKGTSLVKAVSDATGSFAISHLAIGWFDLRVKGKGFATLSVPGIKVADRAARIDLGALTLDRGAVIEGRVTDLSGAPLPEAQVTLSPVPDPLAQGLSVSGASSGTRTDSEGHFRFEELRRGARFSLWVEHSGFIAAAVPAVEAPTLEPLRIELNAGRTVAGRVKSPEGEPVPQAWVIVNSASGSTDKDGRFRLAGVPPGVAELTVDAAGYPRVLVEDLRIPEESDVEGLEIALHQGSVLELQVLDSRRQPVAGIQVTAYASPRSSKYFDQSGLDCKTDPEGRCRFGGIDMGPCNVIAQSEKYGVAQGVVEIGPGVNRQELVLPSRVLVSGRVSDEAGAPVAGATLSLTPTEAGIFCQAISLADGSFQFSAVSEGTYRLSGNASGFAPAVAPDEVRVAGQEVRGLALRLSGGVTLTGRVLGLNPEELASASVSAAGASVRVGWDGRYELTDLAPGEWMISAQARGRAIQEPLQIAPGAREAVLDLRFPSGYTLTGHVTADRAPLAGARIQASSGGSSFQALTGPDGGFQIPNVPSGHYSVTATEGSLGASSTVEVTGDQEVNLDFSTGGLQVRSSRAALRSRTCSSR
jgi:protocatechuate 3,4-dioxygenase beta subunit